MSVKSVYNFVPAPKEDEVFTPDWAKLVNHDIPFSDGESGEIEFTITAETPIFIRNGHSEEDHKVFEKYKDGDLSKASQAEKEAYKRFISFSNYNGKYFIPATSLKGMLRNVLEVITNSRMNLTESISQNTTITYGLRDMNNEQYTVDNKYVKSGWLIKEGDNWVIKACQNHRISLEDIERKFDLNKGELKCSGIEKNNLCKHKTNGSEFQFSFVKNHGKWVGDQYEFDDEGDFKGHIVLYGDIDNKKYDYIFSIPQETSYSVDSKLVETFNNIEENRDNKNESLWLYFRKENWQPGIPVFFTLNRDRKSVKHFGLTKLYRRNNSHYLNKLEPLKGYLDSDKKDQLDFAESLFGTVRTEALKGRVFISNAWSNNAVVAEKPEERILNSPKPSYYPAYLKQNGSKGKLHGAYKTYHDLNAELRGFKRYPIHLNTKRNIESDNENIVSQFIPLEKGAKFTAKIRYFNLRPHEIGALISAITFHGNSDKLFHSIGGVKPYGFGKVKIEIINSSNFFKYLQDFEFIMNQHLNGNLFINQKNIKELLSIASNPKNAQVNSLLTYPSLKAQIGRKEDNEFNKYKKNKKFLENYSERNGELTINSHIDDEFLKRIEQKKIEEQKKEEQKIIEQKKKEEDEFQKVSNTRDISKIQTFLEDNPNTSFKLEAKNLIDEILLERDLAEKKRQEQEEANRLAEKKKKEQAEAIKLVKEITLEFKNDTFKTAQDVLKPAVEKNKYFEYNEAQKDIIAEQIKRCWENDPKSFKKKNKVNPFPKFPWSDIIKWIGEERTKSLYEELTNKEK